MNAVEIEEAISELAAEPFDPATFPFAFLEAFGNKKTTIARLKKGDGIASDVEGGVLQRNHIHMAVCAEGQVGETLKALRDSKLTNTRRHRVRFILATDGVQFEAEDRVTDDIVDCDYADFADRFGFFLPLAGISTVRQIRESAFDIRATGRLNRLYVQLLKDNPEWGATDQRHDMNHFMARLIFCFFAEDTDIFDGDDAFTNTVDQMSAADSSNTHEVIGELFRAMDTSPEDRESANIKSWAAVFPYVNGQLFAGRPEVPWFSKAALSHLRHIGGLDWTKINPDIFGSMIQAVADEAERGTLGMHYTSVPNILKVLNPLFLDDLRARLTVAGDSARALSNLRTRIAKIRVFDPACGSGNFLVIAYKEMRDIEAEINKRRGEEGRRTDIPLTNFRGIELRHFPAEIARLALIIAEFQCDVRHIGQKQALDQFLPLDSENWIKRGNALRLDWLAICWPSGEAVTLVADDLFNTPLDQPEINFENEGREVYICGNPPYKGSKGQVKEQKEDMRCVFEGHVKGWLSLDYVAGWFMKAANYGAKTNATSAFVATNSICQGQQVQILWPVILDTGHEIAFAHTSFKWANLASHGAGVTVVVVGISNHAGPARRLFSLAVNGRTELVESPNINPYLEPRTNIFLKKVATPINNMTPMTRGDSAIDDGGLLLEPSAAAKLRLENRAAFDRFVRPYLGSKELINGKQRYCLWIDDKNADAARRTEFIDSCLHKVAEMRAQSGKAQTREAAAWPHRFGEIRHQDSQYTITVPRVSSESREYLPVGVVRGGTVIGDSSFASYDAPLWNMALIASRLHLTWIATVCGKLKTDYRYSNTMGWNTFPVPKLTEMNRNDLTSCAEDILLIREAHFPLTIADLYNPKKMPADLRHAHDLNDEVVERIYIGRCFRNDTERLGKLFDLYTSMTTRRDSTKENELTK